MRPASSCLIRLRPCFISIRTGLFRKNAAKKGVLYAILPVPVAYFSVIEQIVIILEAACSAAAKAHGQPAAAKFTRSVGASRQPAWSGVESQVPKTSSLETNSAVSQRVQCAIFSSIRLVSCLTDHPTLCLHPLGQNPAHQISILKLGHSKSEVQRSPKSRTEYMNWRRIECRSWFKF